jgi:hypothetical protein
MESGVRVILILVERVGGVIAIALNAAGSVASENDFEIGIERSVREEIVE